MDGFYLLFDYVLYIHIIPFYVQMKINLVVVDPICDQHFEASEVGMLARCLYVPLVSVRVGKVKKRGNILCPTATR